MDQRRGGRINNTIRHELGYLIEELSDPRLSPMTSVTSVDVNRDLSMANVHISVLGTDEEREGTLEALRSAATRLRMEISQRIVIRKMPRLSFFVDDTMQFGADMEKLIDQTMSEDSRRYSDREGK